MGVAGLGWGNTRICKRLQINAIQDHTYIIFYNKEKFTRSKFKHSSNTQRQ